MGETIYTWFTKYTTYALGWYNDSQLLNATNFETGSVFIIIFMIIVTLCNIGLFFGSQDFRTYRSEISIKNFLISSFLYVLTNTLFHAILIYVLVNLFGFSTFFWVLLVLYLVVILLQGVLYITEEIEYPSFFGFMWRFFEYFKIKDKTKLKTKQYLQAYNDILNINY